MLSNQFSREEISDFRLVFLQDKAFTVLRERNGSSSKYLKEVKEVKNSNFLYQRA